MDVYEKYIRSICKNHEVFHLSLYHDSFLTPLGPYPTQSYPNGPAFPLPNRS